jgi:hypothetical protein
MKNEKIYKINILGAEGEVRVSDNEEGRYLCMFNRDTAPYLLKDYKAYGFMVWTNEAEKNTSIEYYPVEMGEKSKLTKEIMHNTWMQIKSSYTRAN